MKTAFHWLLALVFLATGCAKEEKTGTDAPPSHDGSGTPQHDGPQHDGPETPTTTSPTPETPTAGTPSAPQGQFDVTYITEDFTSALVLHPARLLNSPFVKALKDAGAPIDQQLSEFQENSGLDPYNIEQVIVLLDKNTAEMAPLMFGVPGLEPPRGPGFEETVPEIEKEPLEKLEEDKPEAEASDNAAIPADARGLQPVNTFVQIEEPAFPEGVDEEDFAGPPVPTVIVRFGKAIDREELLSHAPFPMSDVEVDGLKAKSIPDGVLYFVDDKTLIVTPKKLLKKVVSAKNVDSHLNRHLKAMDPAQDVIFVADLKAFKQELTMASGMLMGGLGNQPEFAALAPIPSQLDALTVGFGLSSKNLLELNLVLDTAGNASSASQNLTKLLEQGRPQYEQAKPMLAEQLKLENPAANEKVMALADGVVSGVAASSEGPTLKIVIPQPNDLAGLVALLKPEFDKAKQAAKDAEKKNNLKQIGLGFHNYHDVYGAFPGAGSNAEGTSKGLSWRVHLLPMLDEYELYNEFNLDEPWDSDHNKALIARMPEVFQTPGAADEGKTSLHVFLGEQAFALDKGMKIRDMTDGTSNTFLVVQAGADKADVWTKPGGLKADAKDPLAELGTIDGTSFLALFGDGSVRAIKLDIAIETLKALISKNGEEVIDYDSF